MCGRFFLVSPAQQVAEALGVTISEPALSSYRPRYNIAPTQSVITLVHAAHHERRLQLATWGITPAWAARSNEPVKPLINARSETVHEKPVFRRAFEKHRCIIPADGFYEWLATTEKAKRPHVIQHPARSSLLTLAGILVGEGEAACCAILTRGAVGAMRTIHDRMPVLVANSEVDTWLDPNSSDPRDLLSHALDFTAAAEIQTYEVSSLVSKVANDSPDLILPAAANTTKPSRDIDFSPTLWNDLDPS